MTTVESFQVVAAVGAATGVLGLLIPGLRGTPGTARRAGALAVTIAGWLLLVGSLVSRDDLDRVVDRLGSPARVGAAIVGVVAFVAVSLLVVRVCLRRPVVWLVLVALAMPFRVPVSLGGDRSGNLLLPLYWVIGVGIVAWVWARARGRFGPPGSTPMDIPIAAFTAFSLLSIWWSGDIQEGTIKAVFFYLPFVVLYRLVVAWWPLADQPLRAVAFASMGLAAAIAVVAMGQYLTKTTWWNDTLEQGNVYNRFFRANGIFYDPNIMGRYLMVALVAAAAYAWVARRGRDLAVLALLGVIMAGGLTVSFSRSSALGLMIAITLLALRAFGVRRTLLVGGACLAVLGGAAIAANSNVREKATSLEKLASSGEGRFRLVSGGIDLWKTEPVAGVGLGAFSREYRETRSRSEQRRTRVFISHTAPVTVLAELGVIGFGLFAALCLGAVAALWRAARRDPSGGWAQWTILAMLVGIFVHSLLYSALFEDPFVWTLTAAGLAIGATAHDRREATSALPAINPAPAV